MIAILIALIAVFTNEPHLPATYFTTFEDGTWELKVERAWGVNPIGPTYWVSCNNVLDLVQVHFVAEGVGSTVSHDTFMDGFYSGTEYPVSILIHELSWDDSTAHGKYIVNVLGDCLASREKEFWLVYDSVRSVPTQTASVSWSRIKSVYR